jgi:hypothetical protein
MVADSAAQAVKGRHMRSIGPEQGGADLPCVWLVGFDGQPS